METMTISVDRQHTPQNKPKGWISRLRCIWKYRRILSLILPLFMALPIPVIYKTNAGMCAFCLLLMAMYWMTEVIPMGATSLLPMVLFPLLGVMDAKTTAKSYSSDTAMVLIGGLVVAIAVEKWNLHKRIALRLLLLVGTTPPLLLLGFMSVTGLLSLFISNTATTSMISPIAYAVLCQLQGHQSKAKLHSKEQVTSMSAHLKAGEGVVNEGVTTSEEDINKPNIFSSGEHETNATEATIDYTQGTTDSEQKSDSDAHLENIRKSITLCVCYAANIGGTGAMTGTNPNLIMKGLADELYGPQCGVNFSSWFIFAFPNAVVTILVAWIWLQLYFFGYKQMICCSKSNNKSNEKYVKTILVEEYKKLGQISFAEMAVLGHFIVLTLLWFLRQPGVFTGWASFFKPRFTSDGCVAIFVALSLFVFPSHLPWGKTLKQHIPTLLDWSSVQGHLSWTVVLLLGGGLALANGSRVSGLSDIVTDVFSNLGGIPAPLVVLTLSLSMAALTEVASNAAMATLVLPIIAQLASSLQIHPLYLMLPVTLSSSFAFMLPVATAPNAIVFAFGYLRIIDMVKAGVVLNILSILILQISINTYGYAYFNLGVYPDWAESAHFFTVNATSYNVTL